MLEMTFTQSRDAEARLLLGHGAGAGADTPFMNQIAGLLAERGVATLRFEFGYMAARRERGTRRPPPKAEILTEEYLDVVAQAGEGGQLLIGGKSMGGRVASLVADTLYAAGRVSGLVCLGYPFHPPNKPAQLRTGHLRTLKCPALIVQGERDPFGHRGEVENMALSPAIEIAWIGDGDHDLGPRVGSNFTRRGNLATAADAVARFAKHFRC
jgi:predicted alpha/beta-hydrolase family hydrolase